MSQPEKDDPWAACTWEGAREEVLRRGQRMTFREKVLWLEHAARLSRAFAARGTPSNNRASSSGTAGDAEPEDL